MRKVRVAFFADILIENYDGCCRTVFQLIKSIPSQLFEYVFICGEKPIDYFPYKVLELPSVRIPLNKKYKMAVPYFSWWEVAEKLRKFRPDVIHITSPSPLGQAALKYALKNNVPTISIYHTHFISYIKYYLRHLPSIIHPIRKSLIENLKRFYDKCNMVYIPSPQIENELSELGFQQGHMKLWQRGIDLSRFHPSKRNLTHVRKKLGNNYPIILFASRLVWEKNLKTLIKVYELIQSKNLAYNFVIAGDGDAKNTMKEKMPAALFLGNLSHKELSTWYASSDVFLFPSITETFGNVVLESMASGLPVVIANGGGTLSFVKHGFTGFICSPNDPEDYLEKIEILLKNRPLALQFKERALQLCQKKNWNKLTQEYFDDISLLAGRQNLQHAS